MSTDTDKPHTFTLSLKCAGEPPTLVVAFLLKRGSSFERFRELLAVAADEIKCVTDEHIQDMLGKSGSSS